MQPDAVRRLLESVRNGACTVPAALEQLRRLPFESLDFATVDHHRSLRCGFPEVIYSPGKTVAQVVTIAERLAASGGNLLASRVSPEQAAALRERFPNAEHHATARAVTLRQRPAAPSEGFVAVVSAGTSDQPVAEEARVTAEIMDAPVEAFYDVGVAGLHRLLAHCQRLQAASAIVAVAGMEGALASVVAGLVAAPVIAVPTSTGYGANFQGLAPLLTMLNSCASNVAAVNIDNGFGGGCMAAIINRQSRRRGD